MTREVDSYCITSVMLLGLKLFHQSEIRGLKTLHICGCLGSNDSAKYLLLQTSDAGEALLAFFRDPLKTMHRDVMLPKRYISEIIDIKQ